jgi:hypothetical protein
MVVNLALLALVLRLRRPRVPRLHSRLRQARFRGDRSRRAITRFFSNTARGGNRDLAGAPMNAALKASRRDAPVRCATCGRKVERRARQQRFCSSRCRQKANYAEKVARGDFSTHTFARPTNPPKKDRKFKALQRAKMLSSHRILAPAHVLGIEVFGRVWNPACSGGVPIESSRLRARALVSS